MGDWSGVYYGEGDDEYYLNDKSYPLTVKGLECYDKLRRTVFKGKGRLKCCDCCFRFFTCNTTISRVCSEQCQSEMKRFNKRKAVIKKRMIRDNTFQEKAYDEQFAYWGRCKNCDNMFGSNYHTKHTCGRYCSKKYRMSRERFRYHDKKARDNFFTTLAIADVVNKH